MFSIEYTPYNDVYDVKYFRDKWDNHECVILFVFFVFYKNSTWRAMKMAGLQESYM